MCRGSKNVEKHSVKGIYGLSGIINETETCNITLIPDLTDYFEYEESDAFVLLDFYKAFDTVEHQFLFRPHTNFWLWQKVHLLLTCFLKTSSCVMPFPNTSNRFSVHRSVRQGGPSSPSLFLIVVELLSIHILHC